MQGEAAVRRENGNEGERNHGNHPLDRLAEPRRPLSLGKAEAISSRTFLAERLYAGLAASAIRRGFGDEKASSWRVGETPTTWGLPRGGPTRRSLGGWIHPFLGLRRAPRWASIASRAGRALACSSASRS
jgi:hypothetical protein